MIEKRSALKRDGCCVRCRYMWDTDHFVTQVNPEPGPAGPRGISTDGMACAKAHNCRDFVDYDSNVIAVAHGVGGAEKGKKALARIVRQCGFRRSRGTVHTVA